MAPKLIRKLFDYLWAKKLAEKPAFTPADEIIKQMDKNTTCSPDLSKMIQDGFAMLNAALPKAAASPIGNENISVDTAVLFAVFFGQRNYDAMDMLKLVAKVAGNILAKAPEKLPVTNEAGCEVCVITRQELIDRYFKAVHEQIDIQNKMGEIMQREEAMQHQSNLQGNVVSITSVNKKLH